MKKKILFAPLWGIFALSLLSSCRTEDGAITQKQVEDKRFSVFVPKDGKKINYANGFAFLMKRYDELHKTNLLGINNNPVLGNLSASTSKNASVFQSTGVYVEFAVRSQTITEENGDKWVVFPKVEGSKVVSLVAAVLSQKETYVNFHAINKQTSLYKEYGESFQEALDKYLSPSNKLSLNASIKPIAEGETLIKEVILTVTRKAGGISLGMPGEGEPGMGGDGAVDCFGIEQCIRLNPGGGGESSPPIDEADKIDITDLQKYPCAFAIAQQLPNLDNNIAMLLRNIFGNNDSYNITFTTDKFEEKDGLIVDGQRRYLGQTSTSMDIAIALNQDMLETATQEYILSTMYHEVIHAYLDYEKLHLSSSEFQQKYPDVDYYIVKDAQGKEFTKFQFLNTDHNRYGNFIEQIANAIQSFSPNFPREKAMDLAMSGVVNGGNAMTAIRERNAVKYTDAIGKRCNN
ncbi:hypothetical protein [Elizabethkingia anophelis]|uniref:hypothetical protein n=1 Tax=Elizabethkingia anophelis TaxID=1117645 RepID=UPI00259B5DB4|nr:hypothetical protein [Elizabethkingia anophelis]WJK01387.1 hypothetical protein QTN78_06550 [Elizabethkingia anophelis]